MSEIVCCAVSLATPDATDVALGPRLGDGSGLLDAAPLVPPQAAEAVRARTTGTRRTVRCTPASFHAGRAGNPADGYGSAVSTSEVPLTTTVSRSVDVDASPDVVWRLVSDLPGMGRLSPENAGGRWLGDADGPAVGARFRGTNRQGLRRWSTLARVVTCEPGRRFAFDVSSVGLPVARWSYDIAPRPGGCTVTETWTDSRGRLMHALGRLVTGVGDRSGYTALSIEQTLAAVKQAAQA